MLYVAYTDVNITKTVHYTVFLHRFPDFSEWTKTKKLRIECTVICWFILLTVFFCKLVSSWSLWALFLIYLITGTQQANICNLMMQFAEVTTSRIPAENLKKECTYFLLLLLHIMASQMRLHSKQRKRWWCMTYTNC